MNRRTFLAQAAGLSAAAALAAGGSGCAPPVDPDALILRGWPYEPDLVRANLKRLRELGSDLEVDYAAMSGAYHDKMVAQFLAETPLDLVYVRDDHLAEWAEAGWLQPIDAFPGALSYREQVFPFNWEALTLGERLYGLPYYSDFAIWVWNRRMLEEAGFSECGRTLDEVTEQCVKIRERRISGPAGPVEHPLVLGFKQAPLGMNDFWALMYASEAKLFTADLEPIFPDDPDRRAERVLQWLVDGIHRHRIIDLPASFTTALVRDLFAAGSQAMVAISKYDLQYLNDPKRSAVAGEAVMAPYPSLEPGLSGTLGWTRMYGVPTSCRRPEETWRLLEYLGGKDPRGEYSTARFWYLAKGLGFAFPSLMEDPEVVRSTAGWGEIDKIRSQAATARPRECIKAPWFAELDAFYQAEIQEILLRRVTPRDGLARIAAECRRLRSRWQ
ncbi:MAG: extracellular solute-binding protein [Armatimonadota bacterium]